MKLRQIMTASAFALMLCGGSAYAQTDVSAEAVSVQAIDLASDKKYDAALTLIEAQTDDIRNSHALRFAKARILSWAGQYLEAGRAYSALRRDFPNDPDVQVGQAYLEYFRGNLRDAENSFETVLARHPGYRDARTGLRAVKRAKRDHKPWKLDTGLSWSSFENSENSDWTEQFLRAERRIGKIAVSGQVNRYERFDLTDMSYQLMLASHLTENWDWRVSAGITPGADFRPKHFGSAGLGYSFNRADGTTIRTALGYRIDDYDAATIHTISPDLEVYFENGISLTSRLIKVLQSGEDDLSGWLLSGYGPINEDLGVRLGVARAPETVNGEAVQTESLFAGVRWNFTDLTSLNLDVSRDDREDSYIRNTYSVWLSHNF